MSEFKTFADQINTRFKQLQKGRDLFVSSASGDELYAAYLAAFPDGSNPLFRERTEHECSNCRGFVKNFGGLLSINPEDLSMQTVWDGKDFEFPYDVVAQAMRDFVTSRSVGGLFRVTQASFSAQKTHTQRDDSIETWHHFYGVAERQFVTSDGAQAGEYQTSVQVLADSLAVITLDALDTVLGLIEDKQLYRGEEHQKKLRAFREAYVRFDGLNSASDEARFITVTAPNLNVSRFKNSVIGTLVVDIAGGEDLDSAVRSFEAKVAPANYQRTQQVVSQRMIDDALKVIEELGLNVGRRMARIEDVSINNVLWASGEAAPLMKDGLAGLLAGAATKKAVSVGGNATEIGIEQFLTDVLPGATALRVLVAGELQNNFMTLTTSDGPPGPDLFKWDNPFAWSYAGGATDMISERVKAAGGNIKAALRFSLSWTNTDDLDLRLNFLDGRGRGQLLYFGQKTSHFPGLVGGLDVDMNAASVTRTPVENIAFTHLIPGTYAVAVNNYSQREKIDGGFTLQVADSQGVTEYTYPANVPHKQTIDCLTATVDAQGGVTYQLGAALQRGATQMTGQKWGVDLGQYAEVSAVMRSPNHWDGNESGNKHTFFILKDARTDEQPRGIYNEYLNPALTRHRKVLDLIGEKTKPVLTDQQLSGIGVSSTLRKSMIVEVVSAASRRPYRIQF